MVASVARTNQRRTASARIDNAAQVPTTALILGKFLPPHRGHRYLAEEARRQADEVIVCLLANSHEPIPVQVRHAWLEEILPWAMVRSSVADHRIDYTDPAIHDLWAATIRETIGREMVDVLVTSEPAYGDEIAARLGARHVLLDPERRKFPVSGSAIRADPRANLDWLDRPVRRWYEAE
jgi:HTH-type transcriptional regulator, transcriptional repressor of NAD biosynthesis genes